MKWMARSFIGLLSVESSFQFLDRVVGFGDLTLLPVLGLAIFKYYEKGLLEAEDMEDVKEVFADIGEINLLEVLNIFLFYSVA